MQSVSCAVLFASWHSSRPHCCALAMQVIVMSALRLWMFYSDMRSSTLRRCRLNTELTQNSIFHFFIFSFFIFHFFIFSFHHILFFIIFSLHARSQLSGGRIGRGKCYREAVGRAAIDNAPITPAHAKVFMDTSVGEYLAGMISRQPDGPPSPPCRGHQPDQRNVSEQRATD